MALSLKNHKWIKHPEDSEIEFKIKPYSLLSLKKIPYTNEVTSDDLVNIIKYCLLDWKGINLDGEPLKCDDEGKDTFMALCPDLVLFIYYNTISPKFFDDKGEEIKN